VSLKETLGDALKATTHQKIHPNCIWRHVTKPEVKTAITLFPINVQKLNQLRSTKGIC